MQLTIVWTFSLIYGIQYIQRDWNFQMFCKGNKTILVIFAILKLTSRELKHIRVISTNFYSFLKQQRNIN